MYNKDYDNLQKKENRLLVEQETGLHMPEGIRLIRTHIVHCREQLCNRKKCSEAVIFVPKIHMRDPGALF